MSVPSPTSRQSETEIAGQPGSASAMGTVSPPLLSPYLHHKGSNPDHLLRLVDALCASGRSAEAHRCSALLLLSLVCRLDARAVDAILCRLLRADTPLLTLRLLQLLPTTTTSLPNRNRLLAHLYRAGHVLLTHRLLLRMGAAPDTVSYTALLDGYARLPDPRVAWRLLDELPARGVAPTSSKPTGERLGMEPTYGVHLSVDEREAGRMRG